MLKTTKGASNSLGNESMNYIAGESYNMSEAWQVSIAGVFVDAGLAEINSVKETKTVEPTETQAEDAPVKKKRKKK